MALPWLDNPLYHDPYHQDPNTGLWKPRWTPDSRRPWRPGQDRRAWVWPRDKKMSGTPVTSWQRWKDLFTGKGPAIIAGCDRTKFEPTRPAWSNWWDLDNLDYELPDRWPDTAGLRGRRYDFNTRRYTSNWDQPNVFSDAKWGTNPLKPRDDRLPLYVRFPSGQEWTRRNGFVTPFNNGPDGNDFRNRGGTYYWDWARPEPLGFYAPFLHN